MLNETDRQMLRLAYDEAKTGFDAGGCPIGSVLARDGLKSHAAIINGCSKVTRLRMAKWTRYAKPAGKRPIVTRCCTPR